MNHSFQASFRRPRLSKLFLQKFREVMTTLCSWYGSHEALFRKKNKLNKILTLCIYQMKEEFQFPSPLVLKRECVFLRYCKQHGEGLWAVVDVSFDGHGYSEIITTDGRDYTKTTCRRRPSGCIIKTMQDGSSKV